MVNDHCCTECCEPLDFLDSIYSKVTGRTIYRLWICHSEDCVSWGHIWNDRAGGLEAGDPLGFY